MPRRPKDGPPADPASVAAEDLPGFLGLADDCVEYAARPEPVRYRLGLRPFRFRFRLRFRHLGHFGFHFFRNLFGSGSVRSEFTSDRAFLRGSRLRERHDRPGLRLRRARLNRNSAGIGQRFRDGLSGAESPLWRRMPVLHDRANPARPGNSPTTRTLDHLRGDRRRHERSVRGVSVRYRWTACGRVRGEDVRGRKLDLVVASMPNPDESVNPQEAEQAGQTPPCRHCRPRFPGYR